eukprot:348702-Pyramimonas_sp.AAC.1
MAKKKAGGDAGSAGGVVESRREYTRCNLCNAIYAVQYMWCNQSLAQPEAALSTIRANVPPFHPQLGRKTSHDRD